MTWQHEGICTQVDPELFFPEDGSKGFDAKAICRQCPVIHECLSEALADPSLVGIWGGTSANQRKLIRQAKRKASA